MLNIQKIKDNIIHHSVSLRHTLDVNGNPRQGTLQADKGCVYFVPDNLYQDERPRWVITTISPIDDITLTKWDCNRIAKEFVQTYSLQELQKEWFAVYTNTPFWQTLSIDESCKDDMVEFLKMHNIEYRLPIIGTQYKVEDSVVECASAFAFITHNQINAFLEYINSFRGVFVSAD